MWNVGRVTRIFALCPSRLCPPRQQRLHSGMRGRRDGLGRRSGRLAQLARLRIFKVRPIHTLYEERRKKIEKAKRGHWLWARRVEPRFSIRRTAWWAGGSVPRTWMKKKTKQKKPLNVLENEIRKNCYEPMFPIGPSSGDLELIPRSTIIFKLVQF